MALALLAFSEPLYTPGHKNWRQLNLILVKQIPDLMYFEHLSLVLSVLRMQSAPSKKLIEKMMQYVIKDQKFNTRLDQVNMIAEISFICGLA